MFRNLVAAVLILSAARASGASSPEIDARAESYFAIWANDATVTPQAVERYYASRVNFYGREMTTAEVYRSKLSLVRLWPVRTYHVEPGSVLTSCSEDKTKCEMTLVLDWQSVNPAKLTGTQGATTVSLSLISQDGLMKIARESGVPLRRSICKLVGADWRQKTNWQCSPYRFPSIPNSPS